jgi:16S rRNA (guanine966-N2)-methyltransferase
MRIIGGNLKGRIINPGRNFRGRPTTDMAKEGLFNILYHRLDFSEITVLDLFSGSGIISFEFASRGCSNVTCVESDLVHFRFIRKEAEELGLKINIIHYDSFRFIEKTAIRYDIVFADPPFDLRKAELLPSLIMSGNLLLPGGLFILEHSRNQNFSGFPFFLESRHYGHVFFSFFQQNAE